MSPEKALFFVIGGTTTVAFLFQPPLFLWALLTKKTKALRVALFVFASATLVWFPLWVFLLPGTVLLSPDDVSGAWFEDYYALGAGGLFLYSIPMVLPIRWFASQKYRYFAYGTLLTGVLYNIVTIVIVLACGEVSISFWSTLCDVWKFAGIPLSFLYVVFRERQDQSGSPSTPSPSSPPQ